MTNRNDILDRMASRLKEARKSQDLSLDAVAKLSGVSRSMVSQIERGESSPTVSTLWNLTQALQVDFAGLVDDNKTARGIQVMSSAATPTIANRGEGCQIKILNTPERTGIYEVYELRFRAGGALVSDAHGPKAHEQLTVISGILDVTSDQATATLRAGDTARYDANCPHAIEAGDAPAIAFLIVENS